MIWEKKGKIFQPTGEGGWMHTHAQGPTAIEMDNCIRIFFASRPKKDLTLPTYIDVDKHDLNKINYLHDQPILPLGDLGTFDEHGIIPKIVLKIKGQYFLYYIGWSKRSSTPYSLSVGLATSSDGSNFEKYSGGPIIGLEKEDSLSITAPCIFLSNGVYHMFYTSGLDWIWIDGRLEHTYTIRLALSDDGITWHRDFKNIINPTNKHECISNPTILCVDNYFHMWFSYKGSRNFRNEKNQSYRIGYAISKDLRSWQRDDASSGITVSDSGWDSEMLEYPNAININDRNILLYNGNGFGAEGFGWAIMQNK